MSVRAAIAIALALVWLPVRPARAYAWMIRNGYTGCATCHVDPSGAGVLTPYGRAQGDILLQSHFGTAGAEAAPSSNFLWNALRLPDWLLGGGGVRVAELATKVGGDATTTDFILMQADIAAAVSTGGFRATASIGGVTSNGSAAAVAGNVVAREYWVGYSFQEDAWLVRAGRIQVPFGIRFIEHNMYVRQATRTDINDTQQHGVAIAYSGERFRGELMGIAGNFQVSPDAHRERGYSGYVEFAAAKELAIGISSLVTHAADDLSLRVPNTRQAHGAFVRYAPWRPLVLLAEADFIAQSPTGLPSRRGLVTVNQADVEPWQGLHLMLTGETYDPGASRVSYGGWLSAVWFFGPHLDIRADLIRSSDVFGNQRTPVLAYMGQLHAYF
jgi:hypothetical protein